MVPSGLFVAIMVCMVASSAVPLGGNAQAVDGEDSRMGMGEAHEVAHELQEFEEQDPKKHTEERPAGTLTADGGDHDEEAFPLGAGDVEVKEGGPEEVLLLDSISEASTHLDAAKRAGQAQSVSVTGPIGGGKVVLEAIPDKDYMSLSSAMKTKRFWLHRLFDVAVLVGVVFIVVWLYGKMGCPFKRWPLKYLVQ